MEPFYSENFRLGVLGGGQLGRMLIQAATDLNVRVAVLDPAADAPSAHIAHDFVLGDFRDYNAVYVFGKSVDILTVEIEHVNMEALDRLKSEGLPIYPDPSVLRLIRDKGLQKQFYLANGIPTASFRLVENKEDLMSLPLEFPVVQKLRRGGYDGKGVQLIRNRHDLWNAFDAPSVIEDMISLKKELSVLIARNLMGQIEVFPPVEMVFNPEANLVDLLFSPADITHGLAHHAEGIARKLISDLDYVGLLAVEFFLSDSGDLLVNEIAPRPHNSGHHTIEANVVSQFDQHIRAVLNLPLGNPALMRPAATVNLLGEKGYSGPVRYLGLEEALRYPGVAIHLYGKTETNPFRKMGHVTVVADTVQEAMEIARQLSGIIRVISA